MGAWTPDTEVLEPDTVIRLRVCEARQPMTYADVLQLWIESASFRAFFSESLAAVPFAAFRWETPPATRQNISRPFECVLLDAPDLARPSEPDVFADHFGGLSAPEVIGFPNLGNDAFMVVPCPGEPISAYAHLGAFVRAAPQAQHDRLWQEVGEALERRMGDRPIWLNTAGAGVAWLHVRLDSRPKYYHYAPYRQASRE